ncbi:conserved hypothetical protein [Bradyrhizobium sp. STM 3809]|nr:conserved hypothetical protein [Bradyrhizobium sp. STM 3809]
MEDALLSDDRADQERDQHHDGNGLPSDPVHLVDERGHAQRPRTAQRPPQRKGQRRQHIQENGDVLRGCQRRATEFGKLCDQRIRLRRRSDFSPIDLPNLLHQSTVTLGHPRRLDAASASGSPAAELLDQPCANSIDLADRSKVEPYNRRMAELGVGRTSQGFELGHIARHPGSAGTELERVFRRLGGQSWMRSQLNVSLAAIRRAPVPRSRRSTSLDVHQVCGWRSVERDQASRCCCFYNEILMRQNMAMDPALLRKELDALTQELGLLLRDGAGPRSDFDGPSLTEPVAAAIGALGKADVQVERLIRDRPVTATLAAFALGVAVGVILRRA